MQPTLAKQKVLHAMGVATLLCLYPLSGLSDPSSISKPSEEGPPPVRTPQIVKVNRTVPNVQPPTSRVELSESPSDQEVFQAHIFEEPLVPLNEKTSRDETREFSLTLASYQQRADYDDVSAITRFLSLHPDSRWRGALLLNLGLMYYHTAYYTKALDTWEKSWKASRDATEPRAKALADRALGELIKMNARLGRFDRLETLFEQTKGRAITGSATELISGARQGMAIMRERPEIGFRCGPLAVEKIRSSLGIHDHYDALVRDFPSSQQGTSLNQIWELSKDTGMKFQMAFREPGAQIILPAVVNWKAGHFAALTRKESGKLLAEDPTFGNTVWLSSGALDEEASGYFLVPDAPLPFGWRLVDAAEGKSIWGKGQTSGPDPHEPTPPSPKFPPNHDSSQGDGDGSDGPNPGCSDSGMAIYTFDLMTVSLTITDIPVGYAPPLGRHAYFKLTYNQREGNQPANFNFSNLGQKWTFSWQAYITDDPSNTNADVNYHLPGGGVAPFTSLLDGTYAPQPLTQAQLVRTSPNSYEMKMRDGSRKLFELTDGSTSSGRRLFLTRLVDHAGNTVQITYDANLRLVAVTDALGQVTTLSYGMTNDIWKITAVTDPFGRFASLQYNAQGQLSQITDVLGLSSQFNYDTSGFINSMVTPYGITSFAFGENGRQRWIESTDPLGDRERVEYTEESIPQDENTSGPAGIANAQGNYLSHLFQYRNSFAWDKKAMREGPGDYAKAHLYHWLHDGFAYSSAVLESEKAPLENRVWYNYPGNPLISLGPLYVPNAIARILDDGSTQLYQYQRNAIGKITRFTDPVGRTFTSIYSTNLIDLTQVRQTRDTNNELLVSYTYNNQHLPLTITDAAGQTTTFTYNTYGQPLTVVNPLNQVTSQTYDSNGYLLTIDGPLPGTNDTTSLGYDGYGRVRNITNSVGYFITMDYDAFDRPTLVTYPDGTYDQLVYDRLDLSASRDRLGHWIYQSHDPLRRLTQIEDALGRITRLDWCRCGALASITDPVGRVTSFEYDIQDRLSAKQYADGSRKEYLYESSTSRLKLARDEKGQVKLYDYYPDNAIKEIGYANPQNPTPSVVFKYDRNYKRVISMLDGSGLTTYNYYPYGTNVPLGAGRVATENIPLGNAAITYGYDAVGRVVTQAIASVGWSLGYDALGRPTNMVNVLGAFNLRYADSTRRPASITYPNGQSTFYSYYDIFQDERLQTILNLDPASNILSRFTYQYAPHGMITNWSQQAGGLTPQVWSCGYDSADQLTSVVVSSNGVSVQNYAYSYDFAGNRVFESRGTNASYTTYNALNQLMSSTDPATDTRTYEWDAENRLLAVVIGNTRSEFGYDGLGRRIRITEKTNGVIQSDVQFVWCGATICEQRDEASGAVIMRFSPFGAQISDASIAGIYFYTKDHLGSVREVTDGGSLLNTRYGYEPFGQQQKVIGNLDSNYGFCGYYFHAPSGLYLTARRPLDSVVGRWLSRDPIGVRGGLNLFAYVRNNPLNRVDPSGEDAFTPLPWRDYTPYNPYDPTQNSSPPPFKYTSDNPEPPAFKTWNGEHNPGDDEVPNNIVQGINHIINFIPSPDVPGNLPEMPQFRLPNGMPYNPSIPNGPAPCY